MAVQDLSYSVPSDPPPALVGLYSKFLNYLRNCLTVTRMFTYTALITSHRAVREDETGKRQGHLLSKSLRHIVQR